jgi:hypothetical protein
MIADAKETFSEIFNDDKGRKSLQAFPSTLKSEHAPCPTGVLSMGERLRGGRTQRTIREPVNRNFYGQASYNRIEP